MLLNDSRQSRWILKQRPNADFEVYAKRIQRSAHLIKYLEAFMPDDGHNAQSNGMVHAWVGQKLLKDYIFKSFYDVLKLSSGHHSNEYKRNHLPLLYK